MLIRLFFLGLLQAIWNSLNRTCISLSLALLLLLQFIMHRDCLWWPVCVMSTGKLDAMTTTIIFSKRPWFQVAFALWTRTVFSGKASTRLYEVVEHRCSTTVQFISVIMSPDSLRFTSSTVCVWACTITWRKTQHQLRASATAWSAEFLLPSSSSILPSIAFIALFILIISTGLDG